jgi:prefoldin subunit 5
MMTFMFISLTTRTSFVLAITIALAGCGIKEQAQNLQAEISQLQSLQGRLMEKRLPLAQRGVYSQGQCVLLPLGSKPAFACESPREKALIGAAICASQGVQLCRNLVANKINDEWPGFGPWINLVLRVGRESTGQSFCGRAVDEVVEQSTGFNFDLDSLLSLSQEAAQDSYAQAALQKCSGVLCKDGNVSDAAKGEELVKKVLDSTGSCMSATMQACEQRHSDWRAEPEQLRDQCQSIQNDLKTTAENLQARQDAWERLQTSWEYKLQKALGIGSS